MTDMLCMLQMDSNRIIMGGHQEVLIDFDLSTATETKLVSFNQFQVVESFFSYGNLICNSYIVEALDQQFFV